MLSLDEQRRYARQIQLPGFGEESQARLKHARVLVVGAGGLGAPVLSYLAAAGVGTLGIVDHDRVELSNLNRQIVHETGDIGRLKTESAHDRVEELNPHVKVEVFAEQLTEENAERIISGFDIVADGCDNFETRFAVNHACLTLGKPLVSAAVRGWEGQIATFAPHLVRDGACYACFVSPDAPEINTCREAGIIGPLCGIVGSMQALEVIHTLLGQPKLLGSLLLFNGRDFSQRILRLPRDPACTQVHAGVA